MKGRLASIDVLRGVGALMVLLQHGLLGEPAWFALLSGGAPPGSWRYLLAYPLTEGMRGVNLFLVVSGFCIHYRNARQPDKPLDFVPFWRRRLWRLYPPMVAAIVLGLLVHWVAVYGFNPGVHWTPSLVVYGLSGGGWGTFLWSLAVHFLFLIPFFPSALNTTNADCLWTLSLEEQLYMLYFLLPLMRRRLGMPKTVALTLGVSLLYRAMAILVLGDTFSNVPTPAAAYVLGNFQPPEQVRWLQMGPSHWFEWVLGAWAVEMAVGLSPRPRWSSRLSLGALALVAAMVAEFSRTGWVLTDLLWGLGFFIGLNWLVEREQEGKVGGRVFKVLAATGLFSYSLYLAHYPLIRMLKYQAMGLGFWGSCVVCILVCIPISWVFYRLFELPAHRRAQRIA